MSIQTKILDELLKKCPNVDKLYFKSDEVEGYPKTKDIIYYYEDYIYKTYVDKMYFLHRISYEESPFKEFDQNYYGLKSFAYIASPSALTFNTLGNGYVTEILPNNKLPQGRYKIKYEYPLKVLNNNVNASAILKNKSDTMLLIDTKFLENLEPIQDLSEDYKLSYHHVEKGWVDSI